MNTNPALDLDTKVKILIIPKVVYGGLDIVLNILTNF